MVGQTISAKLVELSHDVMIGTRDVATTLARIPMRWSFGLLNRFAAAPERAAEGLVQLAATNAGGASGQLFHDEKPIAASPYAHDEQVQERLWAESARLVGIAN